jgi:hypothetical protein
MMTNKRTKRIIKVNKSIGASFIMIGAVFHIQHWPYGEIILIFGFILGGGAMFFENFLMKE